MSSVAMMKNIGTVHDALDDYSGDELRYGWCVQVMAALDYPRRVA